MAGRKPKPTPPRSEREHLRREMNRFSSMGRFGDWLSALLSYGRTEEVAKIYRMMSDDLLRKGHTKDAERLLNDAVELWSGVATWTGRKAG